MDLTSLARCRKTVEKSQCLRHVFVIICFLICASPASASEGPFLSNYKEAKQLLSRQKWEEAAVVLRSLLKEDPGFTAAAIDLSRALVYLGRREEALGVLTHATSMERGVRRQMLIRRARVVSRQFTSNTAFQIYQDGLNLMLRHQFRAANDRFNKVLEQEPGNVEVLVRLGQCLVLTRDYDTAAENLRLAKRLNPYESETRLWLGRAMHQRGELNLALDELKTAYDQLRNSELAPLWYADILASTGQTDSAVQVLNDDLEVSPLHIQSLIALAQIESKSNAHFHPMPKNEETLWAARKNLQLAQSRLGQYGSSGMDRSSSSGDELGLNLRPGAVELQSEILRLSQLVDDQLEESRLNQ